jgi:phage recombination protein Bet
MEMETIMTTAVAVRQVEVPALSWTSEQVELIKRTIAVGATHDELQLFLYQAKRTGLDPLSRQIHFVKRKDKGTIQTAIDGYRLIADRTGKYAGSDDYLFDDGISQYDHMTSGRKTPTTATVTVHKMVDGVRTPFTATAAWGEYFPGEAQGFMWKKMPYLMIGKCAEALALRKAFPAELSGIYTNEEMMQADQAPVGQTWEPAPKPAPLASEPHVPNYGPYAGQPFSAVPTEGLQDYLVGVERSLADPKKERFKVSNQKQRDALNAEIARRGQEQPEAHAAGTELPQGTGEHASDDPCAPYRRTLSACDPTTNAVQAWWQSVPEELRQDLYGSYTDALKAAARKK